MSLFPKKVEYPFKS